MEGENIYRRIQEFFGGLNDNFSLMEEPVDVATQMKYFEMSAKLCKRAEQSRNTDDKNNEKDLILRKDELYNPDVSIEEKKILLIRMANIATPEIYRILENYAKNPDELLKDWSKLALQENKLLLESYLLDSRQVFISTGLGGKGHKLRYFVVLINKNGDDLKPFQQKVVQDEMQYTLQRYNSELENLNFMQNYTTMRVVVPISSDLTKLFREGIDECNQFGDFLSSEFIVTNMKELSEEEINEALSTNHDVIEDDFPPVD